MRILPSSALKRLIMKKDSELPCVVCVARWLGVILGAAYLFLLVAEKAKAVFL